MWLKSALHSDTLAAILILACLDWIPRVPVAMVGEVGGGCLATNRQQKGQFS